MVLLCAAAAAAPAEAKKKRASIAGTYEGLTEYDGTVSFKLTRAGKILNFDADERDIGMPDRCAPGDT